MPSILDLYSGCGGFSLGAHQAGFSTKLAIDWDPILSGSYPVNFPEAALLLRNIRSIGTKDIRELLPRGVDGVVGGPPCQAFSEIGRRNSRDGRRKLVTEFFRIVALVRPKFFVFENVRGLGFPGNIELLERGLDMLPRGWTFVGPVLLNAADFGAPTRRFRLFVFGFRGEEMSVPDQGSLCRKVGTEVLVQDAIGDLVGAREEGEDDHGFDLWRYDSRRAVSAYANKMRSRSGQFTGHRRTTHADPTLKRFARLKPGARDEIGKYSRLSWDGFCPALRAGTGNDRGSYQAVRPIHPTEHRVITPREAARLQGFPDNFVFHPTVWHSCRMIGNSMSPIVAKRLLQCIGRHL
jgi:DNA (cytosine-5)-methyltransferase 1